MDKDREIEITSDYIDKLLKKDGKTDLQYETIIKLLKENYKKIILKSIPKEHLTTVTMKLYTNKELKQFMEDNFETTIEKTPKDKIVAIASIYLYGKNKEEKKKFLEQKIPNLLQYINEKNIAQFLSIKGIKNTNEEIRTALNSIIESNKRSFIQNYILRSEICYTFDDNMLFLFEKLIEEILKHENKKWIDINYLGSGAYSHVYEIGSKIIKVGEERETYRIPYDKRILQPLIRQNISDLSQNSKGTIEITEKVDTNVDLTEEELYQLYKEIRSGGIICTDLKNSNLGILLKDNKKHWNKPIGESKVALGYIDDEIEQMVLSKGEIVIIDSDYIYYEDDPNIEWGNKTCQKFEERYKQEIESSKKMPK